MYSNWFELWIINWRISTLQLEYEYCIIIAGSLYPEWVGNGRNGFGDQHDRNYHKNRWPKQAGETGGKFFVCLNMF